MVAQRIGAYAVRRSEPDQPLLADSEDTLNKVIALKWIAEWRPPNRRVADPIRRAILEERWADAVFGWMNAIDEVVDVFPFGLEIHEAGDYPDGEFGPRVQTTPLFHDD